MDRRGSEFDGIRLLLVDDDEISVTLLAEMLRNMGIDTVLAHSGASALAILASDDRFDGIMMDCEMPGGTGPEAVRHIRRMPKFSRMPIVAMTGHIAVEQIDAALAAGMTGHIAKPIRLKNLLPVLGSQLGRAWASGHRA